jgi:hypothetical protein
MAVRTDVIIDWTLSPRVITVLSPSTEIIIQDLLDTCREAEDDLPNLIYKQIISAAGKENLGGGVKVGITATLLNAILAFEARPGPTYAQCRVSGGNLVAVDENGDTLASPIFPTAFTQVVTTSSSSATLQELSDIQHSSFEGGVLYDSSSIYSGTAYPVGTGRQPVNNFADAIAIAISRGFDTFYVHGNATIDSGLDFTGFTFAGNGLTKTIFTIDAAANVTNCEFTNASVTGVLDSGATINNCKILNLNYVNGIVQNSIIEGVITLGGDAIFINCSKGLPTTDVVIDYNDSSSELVLRNYNGSLILRNKTQPDLATIDLNSGEITLENTITTGVIVIRGTGSVIDDSIGATIDTTKLVNPENIANTTWNKPKTDFTIPGTLGKDLATKNDVITANIVFK